MITPQSFTFALLLCVLGMLCWGFWANTIRMGGPKWRFELYYFDFAIGVVLFTAIIVFTLGSMGNDITFLDNIAIVRKKQVGIAMIAGGVLNLGNILLAAAIAVAGMSIAFPIGMGLALVVAGLSGYFGEGNRIVMGAGAVVILAAVAAAARAFKALQEQREIAQLQKASTAGAKQKPAARPSPWKGIALAVVGGLCIGGSFPLSTAAREGEIEMAAYPIAFFMALAVFITTFVYNIFLTNLPVAGAPISIFKYFKGTLKQHGAGLLGGAIWAVGLTALLIVASLTPPVSVSSPIRISLGHAATLLAAFCGLAAWNEFGESGDRAQVMIRLSLFIYMVGAAITAASGMF